MPAITVDDFIDAFSAKLVSLGENKMYLNDPKVRDRLFRVYAFLDERVQSEEAAKDLSLKKSLVNLRNLFQPSSIGSFDRLEALFGAKQFYLTVRPNPYYSDVLFPLNSGSAKEIVEITNGVISELVEKSISRYMTSG